MREEPTIPFEMAEITTASIPLLAGKKIIIAGAGIAGLTFAVASHQQWHSLILSMATTPVSSHLQPPRITIYERDAKPAATDHDGYSLSIRSDPLSGGMQVLQKLHLLEGALRASLTGSIASPLPSGADSIKNTSASSSTATGSDGGFVIWDRDWNTLLKLRPKVSDPSIPIPSMRIGRKALRRILIDALAPEDTVNWGVSCTDATTAFSAGGTEQVRVQLSNGTTDTCDLLIAADGAHSQLRASLRPENKLSFAGAVCISGHASFAPDGPSLEGPGFPAVIRKDWGTIIGIGGRVSLFAAAIDEQSAVWSLSYLAGGERLRVRGHGRDGDDAREERWQESLKQEALHRGRTISEPFQTLVRATPASTVMLSNARDLTPFSHSNTRSRPDRGKNTEPGAERVVFIGDSNHAMSPFAGNGANMALMDGWDLAVQLCASMISQVPSTSTSTSTSPSPSSPSETSLALRSALSAYDKLSMPRSSRAIRVSRWTIAIAHAQGWRLVVCLLLLRVMRWVLFRREEGGGEELERWGGGQEGEGMFIIRSRCGNGM